MTTQFFKSIVCAFIGFFSLTYSASANICQREIVARTAIEAKLQKTCADISNQDLRDIGFLSLDYASGQSLGMNDLRGLTGLHMLHIFGLDVEELPAHRFVDLDSLDVLTIVNSRFTSMAMDAFVGLRNIQHITLTHGRLRYLQRGVFRGISTLAELDIFSNELESIEPGAFADLPRLWMIKLWRNRLNTLLPDTFAGATNLMEFDLRENNIQFLPARAFAGCKRAGGIYLAGNRLSHISPDAFQDMGGDLEEGMGVGMGINLEDNELETLPAGVFRNLTQLSTVTLMRNRLHDIPEGVFSSDNFRHSAVVSVEENPTLSKESRALLLRQLGNRIDF